MKSLAETLSFIVTSLEGSSLCRLVRVVEAQQFSAEQFTLKVRAELVLRATLQVRLYRNGLHLDYAYQLFEADQPILRWDNKEHFPELASHPHHFHTTTGTVVVSPLDGDLEHDLPLVLDVLAAYLVSA